MRGVRSEFNPPSNDPYQASSASNASGHEKYPPPGGIRIKHPCGWWGRRDSHGSAVNHFEPSTSAIPSCLRVSSLLKFVIPFRSANPLRFGLLEPLAGTYPCRHPWLDTATPSEFVGVTTAPHRLDRVGPSTPPSGSCYNDYGWLQVNCV